MVDHDLLETKQCLCLASRRAARAITRQFDRALRAHGIRATQFTLLAALELKGPQPIGELARLLVADRTTVTRNLSVAEEQSLVRFVLAKTRARGSPQSRGSGAASSGRRSRPGAQSKTR